MKSTFLLLLAVASLSACSTTKSDQSANAAPKEELEYVTGSALPQKRGETRVAKLTDEQVKEQQRAAGAALDRAANRQ